MVSSTTYYPEKVTKMTGSHLNPNSLLVIYYYFVDAANHQVWDQRKKNEKYTAKISPLPFSIKQSVPFPNMSKPGLPLPGYCVPRGRAS